ncbi:hypothetical protein NC652_015713 [Populus alba x Populus x berolinensis]|nr:hypothetical protein NC652_015713 [Populus alba x Populus x berolinensis]
MFYDLGFRDLVQILVSFVSVDDLSFDLIGIRRFKLQAFGYLILDGGMIAKTGKVCGDPAPAGRANKMRVIVNYSSISKRSVIFHKWMMDNMKWKLGKQTIQPDEEPIRYPFSDILQLSSAFQPASMNAPEPLKWLITVALVQFSNS